MANAENWEIRALIHVEGSIHPLFIDGSKGAVNNRRLIKEIVRMLNEDELDEMVELCRRPVPINPTDTNSLLPTAYEFEPTVPTDGIFPTINPTDF